MVGADVRTPTHDVLNRLHWVHIEDGNSINVKWYTMLLVNNHHCICQICLYVLTHYITTEREVQQIWALSYRKVAHKSWANVGFLTKQLHTGINSQTLLDKPHQKNPLQISTGKWYHDL